MLSVKFVGGIGSRLGSVVVWLVEVFEKKTLLSDPLSFIWRKLGSKKCRQENTKTHREGQQKLKNNYLFYTIVLI